MQRSLLYGPATDCCTAAGGQNNLAGNKAVAKTSFSILKRRKGDSNCPIRYHGWHWAPSWLVPETFILQWFYSLLPTSVFAFYVEPLGPVAYFTLLSNKQGDQTLKVSNFYFIHAGCAVTFSLLNHICDSYIYNIHFVQ